MMQKEAAGSPAVGGVGGGSDARLSPEHLQRAGIAAGQLGRGAEEVIGEIRTYLDRLPEALTPEQVAEATEQAVKKVEREGVSAERAARVLLAKTRSGRSSFDIAQETLDKRMAALVVALEKGQDVPIQRALRTAEAAVTAVEEEYHKKGQEEQWEVETLTRALEDLRGKVNPTLEGARGGRLEAAVEAWVRDVRIITREARPEADQTVEEQSDNYTQQEAAFYLQCFAD